jgi:hypothetical protein
MTNQPTGSRQSSTSGLRKLGSSGGASPSANFFALSGRILDAMHDALEVLVEESRARCALVIDRTGCIMASAGDFHPINPATMGATAAATIAALNTMVSRASSPEVSVKFYGAEIDKIHFVLLEERLVLCLLHSRHATSGQIRSAARSFVNRIGPEIEADKRQNRSGSDSTLLESVGYIEDKLDQLFRDAPKWPAPHVALARRPASRRRSPSIKLRGRSTHGEPRHPPGNLRQDPVGLRLPHPQVPRGAQRPWRARRLLPPRLL